MILRMWRKWRKRKFIQALERQQRRLLKADASGAEIEAKRAQIIRARQALAKLGAFALMASTQAGCASGLTVGALETATVAASEALSHCEASTPTKPGDASREAQRARAECLHIPNFDASADAAGALADELHAARQWVLTGHPH